MSKKTNATIHLPAGGKDAAKKAAVLGTARKGRRSLVVAALASLFLLAFAGILFLRGSGGEAPVVAASADRVTYSVETFRDGKARYYQLKTSDGKAIKFFLLRSADGVIRAAFDACDVCWKAGLGYHQDGDYMVCRNCGQRFASVKVNEERGGCNPAPLKREIEGDRVVIRIQDILEGKSYFDFQNRSRL
ncbi:MAG: DUF2318 domain-containing protein [Thermodesulfobacteriota bacterium]